MAKKIELCTNDVRGPLKSATNLKNTVLPKDIKFEVYLEVPDDLYKEINNDSVLAEKIFKGVSKDYKQAVSDLADLAKEIDVACGKDLKQKGWATEQWDKKAPDIFEKAEAAMLAHSKAAIQKWQQVRKDRKKYVIKTVAKVTIGTLGAATATLGSALAVAGTVASGGGGIPGLIAAIYGNVKAIVQLGKMINRLRLDVDQAEKKLKQDLTSLVKAYQDNSKGQVAAKEMGKALVEQFLAVSMKSVSTAETSMSDFKGKLDKVDINLTQMGMKLNKLIDQQSDLNKQIETKVAKTMQGTGYVSKKLPKLRATSDKLTKSTASLFTDTGKAISKVEDARARYTGEYKPVLKDLKDKKPGWVDNAQLALKLGDLALGAGFTDFGDAASILVLADGMGAEFDDVLAEKIL